MNGYLKREYSRLMRRAAAIENAREANAQKMARVYSEDQYWEEFRRESNIPPLSSEQLEQVNRFWSRYAFAYRNNPMVQAYYTYASGKFDPRYCPEGLHAYYMYRFYDSVKYHTAFHDKNYREFLFHDCRYTPAVAHRVCGNCYDEHFEQISFYEMVRRLEKYVNTRQEKLIVKPTPGGGGNGIQFIRPGDSRKTIADLLDSIHGDDVIIERFIQAHPVYAAANPASLNTLRMITLLEQDEFKPVAIVFRMGVDGNEVDNYSQGGIACSVSPDGICGDFAFAQRGKRYDRHPNGFEFAGYRLCSVDKALQLAEKMHRRVPQFRLMSWDIAVDATGEPMLVEMNPRGGISIYQIWGVLPYGEDTMRYLDEQLLLLYYKQGADWTWDWKEYHDHVVLTKYDGWRKTVQVPEKINGKTVTEIASDCFKQADIKKVIVPGCVQAVPELDEKIEVERLMDTRNIVVEQPADFSVSSSNQQAHLNWTVTDPEACTYVYRMEVGDERKFVKVLTPGVSSFVDRNALSGVAYRYSLRSFRTDSGIFSDWVSAPTVVIRQ